MFALVSLRARLRDGWPRQQGMCNRNGECTDNVYYFFSCTNQIILVQLHLYY